MNEFTKNFFEEASQICKQIDYENVNNLVNELCKLRESNGRLFILGVGGSAGNASHAVNDFRKFVVLKHTHLQIMFLSLQQEQMTRDGIQFLRIIKNIKY